MSHVKSTQDSKFRETYVSHLFHLFSRGTFFFQNGVAGACGQVHSDSDLIVALRKIFYRLSNQIADFFF